MEHAPLPVTDSDAALVLPSTPTREQIERLERHLLTMPQQPMPLRHYHAQGLYAREISIPAGTVLTGAVHKTEHINVLAKGRITVWTEDGMKELVAPVTMVARPGTKRVGYAHEDTVWITFHATDLTDLDAIERSLIEEDPALLARGPQPLEIAP